MKTKSKELNIIWADLEAIFLNYKGITPRVIKDLQKLGIEVKINKHVKMTIKGQIYTISASPSDKYAGRQILRVIRRIYEKEGTQENEQSQSKLQKEM